MNFYASRAFLDAAASVYFKERAVAIEDVRIGDDVLRLLVVDDKTVITRLLFLDFHQPLAADEIKQPVRPGVYAANVSRGVIPVEAWDETLHRNMVLAPLVDWSRFASFEDYQNHLLERHRGLMRDRERRCRAMASKHGELTFAIDDANVDVLQKARQWKGDQLREIGFPDYFDNPQTLEFLQTLRARGHLVSSTLRAGGKLVSLWIGFIHEGSWSGWIFAYDPAFKKYSPGHQLLIRMLEASCRLGHHEFDFSGCAQDYKLLYATHGRLVGDIGTPSLARSLVLSARNVMRARAPQLFALALRVKALSSSWGKRGLSKPSSPSER